MANWRVFVNNAPGSVPILIYPDSPYPWEIEGKLYATTFDASVDVNMAGKEWLLNDSTGSATLIDRPIQPKTEQQIIEEFTQAVQVFLNEGARTRNYDGILSLCSYATSQDPTFSAEGQAGVVWRDACWRHCYDVMADVRAGKRGIPTPEELVSELPAIEW